MVELQRYFDCEPAGVLPRKLFALDALAGAVWPVVEAMILVDRCHPNPAVHFYFDPLLFPSCRMWRTLSCPSITAELSVFCGSVLFLVGDSDPSVSGSTSVVSVEVEPLFDPASSPRNFCLIASRQVE